MKTHIFYSPLEFKDKFNKNNICCIFGGSFDPVHEGHICDLRTLLDICATVILAPTSQNPWKPDQSSALAMRLQMLELVLRAEDIPYNKDLKGTGLILTETEYTYSIELHKMVKEVRNNSFPSESTYWAIGEDLRDSAHQWKNWDESGSDFIVLPTLEGFSGTAIRNNKLNAHPAIVQYIKENKLYKRIETNQGS